MESSFEQFKKGEEESALSKFHDEVQGLKEEEESEMEKRRAEGHTGSIHLKDINPGELTAEDMEIYGKFKRLELTQEEYGDWRGKIMEELTKKAPQKSAERSEFFDKDSRHIFMKYITNKIGFWETWEEKKRESRDFREEIGRMRDEEVVKMNRKEGYNVHLAGIDDPGHLTVRDLEIFKKFKEGSLKDNSEDFRKYRQEIFGECQEYFIQALKRDKELKAVVDREVAKLIEEKEAVGRSIPENRKIFYTPAYMGFQELFSRNNFLGWIQHEIMRKVSEKKKRDKIISEITHA